MTKPQFSPVNSFSFIQTFYADPAAVNGSSQMSLTSIGLFVKTKAPTTGNVSGLTNPGIVVSICDVREDIPDLNKVYQQSFVRKSGTQLTEAETTTGVLSESDVNTFTFSKPVILTTGRVYGIVIKLEDPAYELHKNVAGESLIGTNTVSAGSPSLGSFIPKLYRNNNSGVFTPVNSTDLSLVVKVAKYSANSATIQFTNKDFEFLSFDTRSGNFVPGETVYQDVANSTGTVAISKGNTTLVGTSTTFTSDVTANASIVVTANSTTQQVLQVASVANNTQLTLTSVPNFSNSAATYKVTPVGKIYKYSQIKSEMTLVDSTAANSTFLFQTNNTIVGTLSNATANITALNAKSIDSFIPRLTIDTPATARVSGDWVFADYNSVANTYTVTYSARESLNFDTTNLVDGYDGFIQSRSDEVLNSSLYGASRKSGLIELTATVTSNTTNLYTSPIVDTSSVDIFVSKNSTSNAYTATDANGITYDTETTNRGIALTRHFTVVTGFANNRLAEDIRVFGLGYRPLGTEIRVYAKIHNSADPDTFDDKQWTPLTIVGNADKYSSTDSKNDYIEYEYGFPQYPDSAVTLSGSFTTSSNSNQIACTDNITSALANNDLIKIYSPQFPQNYEVAVATSVNSSVIVVGNPITNTNVIGSGLAIDRLLYKNTGFNNAQNDNIVRYYNSGLSPFDKYDTMQVKIVLLSDSTYIVPKVEQIQVIGVSA